MTTATGGFLILGATGGIGSACVRRLRQAGRQVYLAARDEERLKSLAEQTDSPWRPTEGTRVDDVVETARVACGEFGRLDGIVCAIGSLLLKPAHLTTPDEWQSVMSANLTTAFATVRAAYETLRPAGGSVVLMSSAAARLGMPNHEAIAAAKAGVIGLTLAAAASYAAQRIRVNAIAPGLVQTELSARIWRDPRSAEASRSLHAVGRLGQPEDVASLVEWLLQAENDWITGQVFGVDGGLASVRTLRPSAPARIAPGD